MTGGDGNSSEEFAKFLGEHQHEYTSVGPIRSSFMPQKPFVRLFEPQILPWSLEFSTQFVAPGWDSGTGLLLILAFIVILRTITRL